MVCSKLSPKILDGSARVLDPSTTADVEPSTATCTCQVCESQDGKISPSLQKHADPHPVRPDDMMQLEVVLHCIDDEVLSFQVHVGAIRCDVRSSGCLGCTCLVVRN